MSSLDSPANASAAFDAERKAMIADIRETTRYTSDYTGKKTLDDKVMAAMAKVPRHEFIPENQWPHAYENRPLPIGAGQTISQPYIVALMTDLADIDKDSIVLEVATITIILIPASRAKVISRSLDIISNLVSGQ